MDERRQPSTGTDPGGPGPRADSGSSVADGRERLPRSVWLPLGFIVVTLLAMVVVPVYHARQVAEVDQELVSVLEPAREYAQRLVLAQSEQMASLQAFLLSGEGRFRQRYRTARATEEAVYDSLSAVTGQMDLDVQERMARLWSLSTRWHVGHTPVLIGTMDRDAYEAILAQEQQSYEQVMAASRALQEAIADEVRRARTRVEETWNQQIEVTVGLVLLALGATGAVGFLGWQMASLFRLGQKRRQEAVEARREIDAVLAATGDGVLGVDMEGRCTFLNRAGEELLGIPARRIMGRKVHDLIHHSRPDGEPYPEEECPVLQSLRTGKEVTANQDLLWRPDGSSFPAQLSVRPLVDGLEVRGAVLTFTDLTEIQKTEKALRKAVRARDEVVAVVSHDLRNPLSTISSASELLLELEGLPREKQEEHLRAIGRAAGRMKRLIEDLLDVASIEAGVLSVDLRAVSPDVLIRDAAQTGRPLADEKEIELESRVEEPLPSVFADRDRIHQVFSNLVGNAVRFTPEGRHIVLRAELEGDDVVLEVEDSGPGVPEEVKDHVFDRFWRVDRLDRDGAGLGLAIVKGIVEAHGGQVWVEDGTGSGARFRFSLPVARGEADQVGERTLRDHSRRASTSLDVNRVTPRSQRDSASSGRSTVQTPTSTS